VCLQAVQKDLKGRGGVRRAAKCFNHRLDGAGKFVARQRLGDGHQCRRSPVSHEEGGVGVGGGGKATGWLAAQLTAPSHLQKIREAPILLQPELQEGWTDKGAAI
jgi:hypothetical protein